jgi:hypothetical protein
MRNFILTAAALGVFAAPVSAQSVLTAAKEKAAGAKSAADAHTATMQAVGTPVNPTAGIPSTSASAPKAGAKTSAPKADPGSARANARTAGAKGDSAVEPKADTTAPPPTIYREMFAYQRDGRRDPFVSLLTTNDLRPTMSDLRLTGILVDHSGRGNSLATLRDIGTNAQYRVSVGSTLGRMRVSAIRTTTVVFTIEEFGTTRRDSLVLRDSTNKSGGK